MLLIASGSHFAMNQESQERPPTFYRWESLQLPHIRAGIIHKAIHNVSHIQPMLNEEYLGIGRSVTSAETAEDPSSPHPQGRSPVIIRYRWQV